MGRMMTERVEDFRKARNEEARQTFHAVMSKGFGMLFFGLVSSGFADTLLGHSLVSVLVNASGMFICAEAVILMSTCPLHMINLDELLATRLCSRLALGIGF